MGLLLVVSAALFLDWVFLILAGCLCRVLGAGEAFFCSTYCLMGIAVVVFSLVVVAVYSARLISRSPSAG